jgi:nucleoid-associated protein EbfC
MNQLFRAELSWCYCSCIDVGRGSSAATLLEEVHMGGFNPKQLQELMQQAQQQAQDLQARMQQTVVEASSGGGSVTVKMNGAKQVLGVTIDPEAAKDLEMLQDLVAAAFNAAAKKVDDQMQSSLGGMLGGMGGMFG